MEDTISIIVPVYNAEKYITACIKSIQKQTYKNWKLILVNDGSKDLSGEICDCFANKDQRITVIHQENKGSVEARKAGVLCQITQNTKWAMFCDADDTMPSNAIEKLYQAVMIYGADMAAGAIRKVFKGISVPGTYQPPCFRIDHPVKYTHQEVLDELFISYFGISNFPVNLIGKLYRTEILIEAIDFPAVVQFMGDDLSVSIRIVPKVQSLVIVPSNVYNYRIGGGTSKFMPYMMNDFANLYSYKQTFIMEYQMPQDAQYYMDIELMNVTKTHFLQCITKGKFNDQQMIEEINKVCKMPQVQEASGNLISKEQNKFEYANDINSLNVSDILKYTYQAEKQNKKREMIKRMLAKL